MSRRFIHGLSSLALAVAVWATPATVLSAEPDEPESAPAPSEPRAVEVTLTDKSVLRLNLADERIEIATPHGKLQIPAEDVLRIEFANRPPAEVTQAIDGLLNQLRGGDPNIRRTATAELVAMREEAYLPLVKAAKSGDPNLAPAASAALAKLRAAVPQRVLDTMRDEDFITTSESKIAGRITLPSLKVRTTQFGELALKLADARSLRHQSLIAVAPPVEDPDVLPDPGNLKAYEAQHGKIFAFKVIGAAGGGGLWGTRKYTTDSRLAMAAVHMGVLKPGETGVVRVKMHPAQVSFTGSSQHGVTSSGYGPYSGAFEVLTKDAEEE